MINGKYIFLLPLSVIVIIKQKIKVIGMVKMASQLNQTDKKNSPDNTVVIQIIGVANLDNDDLKKYKTNPIPTLHKVSIESRI